MTERQYKVRCLGTEDANAPYELSYGKGSKKIVVKVERAGSIFKCVINGVSRGGKIRELKELFEEWAKAAYGGEVAEQPVAMAAPVAEPVERRGPIAEDRSVKPMDSKTRRKIGYDKDGNKVRDDVEEPLPVVGTDGEVIEAGRNFEIRQHKPNARFPYTDGYALIALGSRIQYGWMKDKSRAIESLKHHDCETQDWERIAKLHNKGEQKCQTNTESNESTTTPTSSLSDPIITETTSSLSDPLPSISAAPDGGRTE